MAVVFFSAAGRVSLGQMETSCTYMLLPGRCCRTPTLFRHASRVCTALDRVLKVSAVSGKLRGLKKRLSRPKAKHFFLWLRLRAHGADALSQRAGPGAAGTNVPRTPSPWRFALLALCRCSGSSRSRWSLALRLSGVFLRIGRWLPA